MQLSCKNDATAPVTTPGYQSGQNYYTLKIDGENREYYVYVPANFDDRQPVPLVFMLHGASASGEGTYNNSGWKELADTTNILTVFPTAWQYCYHKANGLVFNETRWNSMPGVFTFCAGETPRDDVKFLRQIIIELQKKFNIDSKRIYMVGFSSGAQMAFRCAVEMSDVLAAVVQSGASHHIDTVFTPIRNLPVMLDIGNEDETWFGSGTEIPMAWFDSMLVNYSFFKQIVSTHRRTFDFETAFSMSGDTTSVLTATFNGVPEGTNRPFQFSFIKGLTHAYPNTVNHNLYGARRHWNWLKQYTLP